MRKRSKKGGRLLLAEYSRASESTGCPKRIRALFSGDSSVEQGLRRLECLRYTAQKAPFPIVHQEHAYQGHRRGNESPRCISRAEGLTGDRLLYGKPRRLAWEQCAGGVRNDDFNFTTYRDRMLRKERSRLS